MDLPAFLDRVAQKLGDLNYRVPGDLFIVDHVVERNGQHGLHKVQSIRNDESTRTRHGRQSVSPVLALRQCSQERVWVDSSEVRTCTGEYSRRFPLA